MERAPEWLEKCHWAAGVESELEKNLVAPLPPRSDFERTAGGLLGHARWSEAHEGATWGGLRPAVASHAPRAVLVLRSRLRDLVATRPDPGHDDREGGGPPSPLSREVQLIPVPAPPDVIARRL